MNTRRSFRVAAAALAACATVPAIGAPAASAANAPIVAGGSFARTIPFVDGNIVAFECHAAAAGAVSTTISSCALNSVFGPVGAPPVTQTGPAATTDGAVSIDPANYQVCWTASAVYSDASSQSTSGCSTSGPLIGAG